MRNFHCGNAQPSTPVKIKHELCLLKTRQRVPRLRGSDILTGYKYYISVRTLVLTVHGQTIFYIPVKFYRLVTAKCIGYLSTKILKYVFDIVVLIPALKIQGFEY